MKYKDFSDMLQKKANDLPMIFALATSSLTTRSTIWGLA